MRTNTYDPQTGVITVSDERARAIALVGAHYSDLFTQARPPAQHLRELYALPHNAMLTADEAHALTAFFFWTAWAAATERPGDIDHLHQQLAARAAGRQHADGLRSSCGRSSRSSSCSAGIGALVWYYAREFDVWRRDIEPDEGVRDAGRS